MLNEYYERLENELGQAKAAIDSAENRVTEARRALEREEKMLYDASARAARIVSKQCRIEASEYAQRDFEIALYGVCIPWS